MRYRWSAHRRSAHGWSAHGWSAFALSIVVALVVAVSVTTPVAAQATGTILMQKTVGLSDPSNPDQTFTLAISNTVEVIGASPFEDGDPAAGLGGLGPGDYSVSEVQIPLDWALTSLECESRDGTSSFGSFDTAAASRSIELGAGDQVTCTFTNNFFPNVAPIAEAGGPYSGPEGTPITLDASSSTDLNGDDLAYGWSFGPAPCSLDAATAPRPSLTCDDGNHTLTLTAGDGRLSDGDTATVTVTNLDPVIDGFEVVPPTSELGSRVTASAEFSDAADEPVGSIDWGDGTTSTGLRSGFRVTHTYDDAGTYDVVLGVDDGTVTVTAARTVQVEQPTVDPPPPVPEGYWLLESDGEVTPFGEVQPLGDVAVGSSTAVAIASTPDGQGYWVLAADGTLTARGTAPLLPDVTVGQLAPGEQFVAMVTTSDGQGVHVFTDRGRVIAAGSARPLSNELLDLDLDGPIVGATATGAGSGAYMVGADGGVFSIGDARFHGSVRTALAGGLPDRPVVGISPDPDGTGYWVVGADGGVFAFAAPFRGSLPALVRYEGLVAPINGMVPYGDGYLLIAGDGGVFNFSDRSFAGSGAGVLDDPVVDIAATR